MNKTIVNKKAYALSKAKFDFITKYEKTKGFKAYKKFIEDINEKNRTAEKLKAEYEAVAKEIQLITTSPEFLDVAEEHRKAEAKVMDLNAQIVGSVKSIELGEFEKIQNVAMTDKLNVVEITTFDQVEDFKNQLREANVSSTK